MQVQFTSLPERLKPKPAAWLSVLLLMQHWWERFPALLLGWQHCCRKDCKGGGLVCRPHTDAGSLLQP